MLPPAAPPTSSASADLQPTLSAPQVVDSIFTPGTNAGLIKAMSFSFYALFATLATLVYATEGNLHVCALLALSVALYGSIRW